MKKDNETSLVRSILAYLATRGIFAWRNNTGAVVSEYKGKKRFTRFGEPGSPDIIGCKSGQMICIECKLPGNKPTEAQYAWLSRAEHAGALCIIAFSIDDVEHALEVAYNNDAIASCEPAMASNHNHLSGGDHGCR